VSSIESEKSPVSQEFLAILLASNTDRAREIEQLMRAFADLKGYGWTDKEVLIAVETGYDYTAHLYEGGLSNWKWRVGAGPMYNWLRHHYLQMKAEDTGLGLDEFIAQWRTFVERGYNKSLQRMALYCKARRYDINPQDVECVIKRYDNRNAKIYVELKRKNIPNDVISMVMVELSYGDTRYAEIHNNFKYFIEACRRGADYKQLREALRDRGLSKLALSLRREQREVQ